MVFLRENKELSVLETTVNQLIDFIQGQRAVSFDQIHEYMLMEKLRFGPAVNPIGVLAQHDARIDVDYDQQMVYSRGVSEMAGSAATSVGTYRSG